MSGCVILLVMETQTFTLNNDSFETDAETLGVLNGDCRVLLRV